MEKIKQNTLLARPYGEKQSSNSTGADLMIIAIAVHCFEQVALQ
jgi:hypothetical protein